MDHFYIARRISVTDRNVYEMTKKILLVHVEMVQFKKKQIKTENSCCITWFPVTASCYKIVDSQTSFILYKHSIYILTLWHPAAFEDFQKKKTPKRTWLCMGISPVRYALQTR